MDRLPCLEVLMQEELERIYQGALWVLANVGIQVEDAESRELFQQIGAEVDELTHVVKIPASVVRTALQTASEVVRMVGRNGSVMEVGGDNHYHGTSSVMVNMIDYRATEMRRSTKQDCANIARIADALPRIAFGSHTVQAWDFSHAVAALHGYEATLANTSKHCMAAPQDLTEAQAWTDLAEIANQGYSLVERPIISIGASTISPLQIDGNSAQVMMHAVKKGVPLLILPMPLAGGTAPITLAGALVMENAEALSVLVLSQAIRPGAPFIYGAVCTIMDQRKASASLAAPEFTLLFSAKAQMARFLGLPSYSGIGSVDSPRVDVQAGLEAMLCYLPGVLSGLNLTVSAGGMAVAKAYSYEMIVIDHDILETCERFRRGIRVDEDTLALEVISEIGHEQHFLDHPHTIKYLRSGEHYYSKLFDRWTGLMAPSMLERAHERVQQILREHRPNVPEGVLEEMRRYVGEREKEFLTTH